MHVPVLLDPTVELLAITESDVVLDATVGFGGHASEIIKRYPKRFIGMDQDPAAIEFSHQRLGHQALLIQSNFQSAKIKLQEAGISALDKVLIDLGISSYQLDHSGRGFSFLKSEPLDMRMNPESGQTAAQWLRSSDATQLSDAFYHFGELIHNKKLVESIVISRRKGRIERTDDLNDLIKRSYYFGSRPKMMKIMSQVYQAIRIAINNELNVIPIFFKNTLPMLSNGGRIAIITFHSIEDRLVKHFFQEQKDYFRPVNKKVIVATDIEIRQNSRAKSAKLRVYERIAKHV
ncbi:16S rRNA (cytosine(1402)-N(4))-methyltransferase RsmH [bacterium]|nr:16S rRNA (cytosine(1402)-N(4))-methyltransferase RsmH [bacterium]